MDEKYARELEAKMHAALEREEKLKGDNIELRHENGLLREEKLNVLRRVKYSLESMGQEATIILIDEGLKEK